MGTSKLQWFSVIIAGMGVSAFRLLPDWWHLLAIPFIVLGYQIFFDNDFFKQWEK